MKSEKDLEYNKKLRAIIREVLSEGDFNLSIEDYELLSESVNARILEENLLKKAWDKYGKQLTDKVKDLADMQKNKEKFAEFKGKLGAQWKTTAESLAKLYKAVKNKEKLSKDEKKQIGNDLKEALKTLGFAGATVLPGGFLYMLLVSKIPILQILKPEVFMEEYNALLEEEAKKNYIYNKTLTYEKM